MSSVQLLHGDCLALLPTLPAGSVDAVVTDPPYGQTNEKYDSAIAFDAEVWRACFRVAAPNAALISLAGAPTYHRIAAAVEAGGWMVRQMWAWVYRNGFITSAWPREGFDRLAPAMDPIIYATKGKVLLKLNREGAKPWERQADSRGTPGYSERASSHGKTEATGHWPRSVVSDGAEGFEYFALNPNTVRSSDPPVAHPNQKPLALMRWLVGKMPGRTVLDPFAGSGTTLVACLYAGLNAIGIEQNPAYFAVAERRIAEAQYIPPLYAAAEKAATLFTEDEGQ